uniref:G protein-coupled receptor n=1 Tax=Panagrolaimus davidi TaxID=227884 RepID=A0A914Q0R9_9BILA
MHPDTTRTLNRVNGIIAGSFGFVANIILIAFILRSNTKAFRKVFLQVAIIDLIFLLVTAAAEPIIMFVEGSELVVQNGYFRHIAQPYSNYMISAWIFGMYFSISSISVQFLYRYLILCRKMQPSALTFMGLLTGPFLVSLGISLIFVFGYAVTPDDEKYATELLKDILVETGETHVFAASVSRKGSTVIIVICGYVMCVITSTYVIIIFCVIKIRATLKISQTTMSKETRQLQNQLSWTFGMQALSPLVISFGPLGYLAYTIMIQGTAFWSMMWFTTGFAWVPFTNAMLTLCFVGEFRQKLMFFRKHRSYVSSSNNNATLATVIP